jgi:succinate dehydrogenase / fumarate reductase membrane anchor subunit
MIGTASAPKSGENTWLWLLKLVTGVLVIVILGIHLAINHFISDNPGGLLSYADVVAYYQNPIIPIMEVLFLIFVVSHSLLGLRSILLDLKPSRSALAAINVMLSVVGVTAVGYGIWLISVIVARGA